MSIEFFLHDWHRVLANLNDILFYKDLLLVNLLTILLLEAWD